MSSTSTPRSRRRKLGAEEWAQAQMHPTRRRIMLDLAENGRTSPVRLARAMDKSISGTAHHFHVLVRLGVIKPAGTAATRGTIEHFYALAVTEAEIAEATAFPRELEKALAAGNGVRT